MSRPRFYAPPRCVRPVVHATRPAWRRHRLRVVGALLTVAALTTIFATTWHASIAIACPAGGAAQSTPASSTPSRKTDLRCDFSPIRPAASGERDSAGVMPLPRFDPDSEPRDDVQLHARRAPTLAPG
jgi:hypothetical protein